MANMFEVQVRLAEGRLAVDNTATYVWACAQRGFSHPDLTVHGNQVRDWYGTLDGLDLLALDADAAELRRIGAAAQEAAFGVPAAHARLAGTWTGGGSAVALNFLTGHGDVAASVAASVAAAAAGVAALCDELWRVLDARVRAAVDIDERASVQREQWLTAARLVIAGSVDEQATATVDNAVLPYVSADIAVDWLTMMRDSAGQVFAAYRQAVAGTGAFPGPAFAIPGDLGPAPVVSRAAPAVAPVVQPGEQPVLQPDLQSGVQPTVPAAAPAVAGPEAAGTVPSATEPVSSTSPALPDLSGLTGLPGQIADGLGGLLGGAADPWGGSSPIGADPIGTEPFGADPFEPQLSDQLDADADESEDFEQDSGDADPNSGESEADSDANESEAVPEPEPVPVPEPEPVLEPEPEPDAAPEEPGPEVLLPPAPVEPPADALQTPCQVAANELPQVGS